MALRVRLARRGPAGADGADGADGAQGPAGPAGPQGPAGIPDTGGIDPIQLAQAHHIAMVVGDADKADATVGLTATMRVGEELMISAVAGAQSGKALPGIPVAISITKNDDEAITLEDGVITAAGAGSAEITAESELAGISGTLTITSTKPISKIVFDPDDSEYFLAAGQTTDKITATAQDEDGNDIAPRSNWSWSSADDGVATVAQTKVPDPDDATKMVIEDEGQHARITGAGQGDTMIMATAEGVSGSINVSVTGQSVTRVLSAGTSSLGNVFTWDRGFLPESATTAAPSWTGRTGNDPPSATAQTTVFRVDLYDAISGDRIEITATNTPSVTSSGTAPTGVDITTTAPAVQNGSLVVSVGAPDATASGFSDADADTYESFLTISATGANPLKIRFAVVIVDAPE